jgi:hypothetical protein
MLYVQGTVKSTMMQRLNALRPPPILLPINVHVPDNVRTDDLLYSFDCFCRRAVLVDPIKWKDGWYGVSTAILTVPIQTVRTYYGYATWQVKHNRTDMFITDLSFNCLTSGTPPIMTLTTIALEYLRRLAYSMHLTNFYVAVPDDDFPVERAMSEDPWTLMYRTYDTSKTYRRPV